MVLRYQMKCLLEVKLFKNFTTRFDDKINILHMHFTSTDIILASSPEN